jgi:hypothetical protein
MIFSSRDRPASSSSRLRRIAQANPSATESPTCSVPFSPNSEAVCEIGARGRAPRIRGHCSSAATVAYIEPEWMLVPGPFLCVMTNSGGFAAAGTATAVMALGRTKSGVGGTSKRPRNSDKVAQYEGRVGRRMASRAREKARRGAAPGRACLRSKAAIAAGQIGGKAVDQFHFLGKITAEIRGTRYANRTRVECRLGGT